MKLKTEHILKFGGSGRNPFTVKFNIANGLFFDGHLNEVIGDDLSNPSVIDFVKIEMIGTVDKTSLNLQASIFLSTNFFVQL